jgi:hypothetical protein
MQNESDGVPTDMVESNSRYKSLCAEVQYSSEAAILAHCLINSPIAKMGIAAMLCVAFSQGVMVGCEMEKADTLPSGVADG